MRAGIGYLKRNTNVGADVSALVSVHREDRSSVADNSEVHAASIFRAEDIYIFCNTAQIHTVQKCKITININNNSPWKILTIEVQYKMNRTSGEDDGCAGSRT
jgi:hypothetical protein